MVDHSRLLDYLHHQASRRNKARPPSKTVRHRDPPWSCPSLLGKAQKYIFKALLHLDVMLCEFNNSFLYKKIEKNRDPP